MNSSVRDKFVLILCLSIILIPHLFIFNHYFSLQEGWWETYAYLVNRGEVINKDFYLAWTPLFVYINAFYQKIFGINFFAFACIGVVAAMIQVILLYLVLREFFSKPASAIGATFASFLWFSMETYIPKDYHVYVFIIEFSTLLFLVKSIKNENSKKGTIYQILGILFLVLLFFIKQNVGLVLFASLFVSYAFISSSVKDYFKRIGFLLLFTAIFFVSINFIIPFDPSSITDNDSKGSLWTVAMRFIFEPELSRVLVIGVLEFFIILILAYFGKSIVYLYDALVAHIAAKTTISFQFTIIAIELAALTYVVLFHNTAMLYIVRYISYISFSIAMILYIMFSAIFYKNSNIFGSKIYIFITFCAAAIVYSNTFTTIALNMNSILLCAGLAFGFLLNQNLRKIARILLIYWMLIMVSFIVYVKFLIPYNWLENYQGSVFEAKSESSYIPLKNIYMNQKLSYIFDYMHDYVPKNTVSDKDFYFFNLPIMYLLNDKIPPYNLVTQWFDVTPTRLIKQEYIDFTNRPTENIILYQYYKKAFDINKRLLRKDDFIQEDFYNSMNEWVKQSRYKFIKSFVVPNSLMFNNAYKNLNIQIDVIIQNSKFFGQSYEKFYIWLQGENLNLMRITRDGAALQDINDVIRNSDIVTLSGNAAHIMEVLPQLGVEPIGTANFNTINIYRRNE